MKLRFSIQGDEVLVVFEDGLMMGKKLLPGQTHEDVMNEVRAEFKKEGIEFVEESLEPEGYVN